jgi:hypothetical protein
MTEFTYTVDVRSDCYAVVIYGVTDICTIAKDPLVSSGSAEVARILASLLNLDESNEGRMHQHMVAKLGN